MPREEFRPVDFEALFRLFPEAGLIVEAAGRIVDANEAATRLSGHPRAGLVSLRLDDLLSPVPDLGVLAPPADPADPPWPVRPAPTVRARLKPPRGRPRTVEVLAYALPAGVEPCRYVVLVRDVDGRTRIEEHERRLERMDAVEHLAARVAHEFNNVLGAILGHASFGLTRLREGSDVSEDFRAIEAAARRGTELTKQLQRCTAHTPHRPEPFDVNTVLRDVGRVLTPPGPAHVRVELALEPGLWLVQADAEQLRQVFLNLGTNAQDAMPQGGTLILKSANIERSGLPQADEPSIAPGRYVRITVQDTGHGMDEATRERLFEPFYTTKARRGSGGLGLAAVYGIVRNHGGRIHLESAPGEGTRFDLYFPAAASEPASPEPAARPALPPRPGRVLLIDDDAAVRSIGAQMLSELGFDVVVAASAHEGLVRFEDAADAFAFVLLDVVLPDISGRECFLRIRAIRPDARVLLLSGCQADGAIHELLARGAAGFLPKPFGFDELEASVRPLFGLPAPAAGPLPPTTGTPEQA